MHLSSIKHMMAFISVITLISSTLLGCSSQELQSFGKDVVHNVGCDQQYQHMPKEHALKDECLQSRP